MNTKKELAGRIRDHLKLYSDLGVRWVRAPEKIDDPAAVRKEARRIAPHSPVAAAAAKTALFPETAISEDLETIRADLKDCRLCKLSPTRKNIVFGAGNPNADLMFVGEAPGADEDEQGLPFVGRAGQLLTKIIQAIGMRREEVFICNILKCRPPGNRNPEPDEIAACEKFLFRQIASVKPKVICALGAFSAKTLLRSNEAISRLRGHLIDYRGAKLIATFHPAYLLRNPNEKRKVWEDMQTVRDYIASLS
ncbi:MAG: uracil-DNA glycosylase [Acidobacteria bacterium]|nr:uracil-DNA glycosylase [Acidobacteriota bacterium]